LKTFVTWSKEITSLVKVRGVNILNSTD